MTRWTTAMALGAMVIVVAGCATKDWVKQALTRERGQTDQQVAGLERQVSEEGRRVSTLDDRVGGEAKRVDTLGAKVEEVDGRASTARERAEGAAAKVDDVDSRLTRLWSGRHKRTVVETQQILFGFDRWDLDDGAQTALRDVVTELKKNAALGVALEGYADPRGAAEYNVELSRRRVEAVRRYLVGHGVELWRIASIGLGVLAAPDVPDAQKRRVSVTLTLAE
jgi:outer membrane protein OmpA-like peptidoglycan-associated protein